MSSRSARSRASIASALLAIGLLPIASHSTAALSATPRGIEEDPLAEQAQAASGPDLQTQHVEVAPAPDQLAADPSVTSLVSEYNITPAQAQQQMELQVAAGRAERDMPPQLRQVYAGRQIRHDQGGSVTVALTDETLGNAMRSHFSDSGVEDVALLLVPHSDAQIEARLADVRATLGTLPPQSAKNVAASRSTLGKITLSVAQAQLHPVEEAVVATARSAPELYEIVSVETIPISRPEACDFTGDIECDPPLRGSIKIYTTENGCSGGFNVVSVSDGKPYLLTAGHCSGKGVVWSTQFENEEPHVIGPMHNRQEDAETDAGILTVNNPAGWLFGRPWITVDPTGGHAEQQAYVIRDSLSPRLGDRVCATLGNTARTDCGTVLDESTSSTTTDGLFQVSNLCTEPGDSGSPYFSYGVAYGIHIAGDGLVLPDPCEYGMAEHIQEALTRMNVAILIGS